jgi:MFS family permease
MNTAVLEPRTSGKRPGRTVTAAIGVVMLMAFFFVAVAALPYFTFLFSDTPGAYVDEQQFRLYFPKRGWLLLHIAGGMIALLAGPVQLWLGLSDRRMDLHRRLGVAYIAGIAIGVTGAVALAVQTDLGWVFGAGLLGLSLAWVVTTGLAFAAIRQSLVEQHRE